MTIQNGNAKSTGNDGSGIKITNCSPAIEYNIIKDNILSTDSTNRGAGIYIYGSSSSPLIRYNEISHNMGSSEGSAIHFYYAGDVNPITVEYNTITDNHTQGSGTIYADHSSFTIKDNTITDNSVNGLNSRGGGICVDYCTNSLIEDNRILRNQSSKSGAGIYSVSSEVIIRNNEIVSNDVLEEGDYTFGGGIYSSGGEVVITGNTITNNTAYKGGGMYVDDSASFTNNTIANNIATYDYDNYSRAGAGIYAYGSNCSTGYDNIICGNNSSPQFYHPTYEPNEPPGNTVCPTCTGDCAF